MVQTTTKTNRLLAFEQKRAEKKKKKGRQQQQQHAATGSSDDTPPSGVVAVATKQRQLPRLSFVASTIIFASVVCAFLNFPGTTRSLLEASRNSMTYQQSAGNLTTSTSTSSVVADDAEQSNGLPSLAAAASPLAQPVFSLSLPNTGASILPRYFECGGHYNDFGRYWTTNDFSHSDTTGDSVKQRKPIGLCMQRNLRKKRPMMQDCGDNEFQIWQELAYKEPRPKKIEGLCFDPVMHPGALEHWYNSNPNATIINMIPEDPKEWYQQLSYDTHLHWKDWCNPTHDNAFPTENTEEAYVDFFHKYHQRIRDFVKDHPRWTLIEINTAQQASTDTANTLENYFHIPASCWMGAVQGSIPIYDMANNRKDSVIKYFPRPNDITYPILLVSMPKSGTTTVNKYMRTHTGTWTSNHQHTKQNRPPFNDTTIGQCMAHNHRNQIPILDNCGYNRVFTDIGVFYPQWGCYFAQLMGGMEEFAKAYPYATIMLSTRSASSWVDSAERYGQLKGRMAVGCMNEKGLFPRARAPDEEWEAMYQKHVQDVRQFVMGHPTLTYIEVPLSEKAGPILDDIFGFHHGGWGHANANPPTTTKTSSSKQ